MLCYLWENLLVITFFSSDLFRLGPNRCGIISHPVIQFDQVVEYAYVYHYVADITCN
jgi:hypothetical protein